MSFRVDDVVAPVDQKLNTKKMNVLKSNTVKHEGFGRTNNSQGTWSLVKNTGIDIG